MHSLEHQSLAEKPYSDRSFDYNEYSPCCIMYYSGILGSSLKSVHLGGLLEVSE